MICNAEDLSPDQKAAVETLLGRRVREGEAVSVRTFEPVTISRQRKLEIADELRKYFAEVDARRKAVSEEEAEEIITEAMRSGAPAIVPISENHSRYGYSRSGKWQFPGPCPGSPHQYCRVRPYSAAV